jgi:hypothetical protein
MPLKDCLTMHVQFCSNYAYSYLFINSLIGLDHISISHYGGARHFTFRIADKY